MKRFFALLLVLALLIGPAKTDGTLTLVGAGAGSNNAVPASISYCSTNSGTASGGVLAFVAQSVCSAAGSRQTLVATFSNSSVTSVLAGATNLPNVGSFGNTQWWMASFPTGATDTITVNTTGPTASTRIGVWGLYDLNSATPIDSQSDTTIPGSITLTTQSDGVAVGGAFMSGAATAVVFTGVTERFDASITATLNGAGGDAATAGTSLGITATYSGGPSSARLTGLSWR